MRVAPKRQPRLLRVLFPTALGLASPTIGVGVGLILPSGIKIHLNFFSVVELIALGLYLIVSMLTYFRIFELFVDETSGVHKSLFKDFLVITIVSVLLTFVSGALAAACASMPHLHLAGLVALVSSFGVFDLLFLKVYAKSCEDPAVVCDGALQSFALRVGDWFKHTNLPTLVSFLGLYSIVALMVWANLYQDSTGNHTYHMTEAFTSGAAAFHLVLLSLLFLVENRNFIATSPLRTKESRADFEQPEPRDLGLLPTVSPPPASDTREKP